MDTELLQRLETLELDHPESDFSFSERLARENGWSKSFTERVLQEYRRFLYLSAKAGHPVTPSDAVDQAWHLHLCYTESYWHDLCCDVLGFPLHHGPTKGGSHEQEKFRDWYSKTLESYRSIFGTEPPTDIWPGEKKRFRSIRFERVDRDANFVIPKKLLSRPVLLIALSLTILGCGVEIAEGDKSIEITVIVALFIAALTYLAVRFGGRGGGGNSSGGCGGGCGSGCGGGCGGCGS